MRACVRACVGVRACVVFTLGLAGSYLWGGGPRNAEVGCAFYVLVLAAGLGLAITGAYWPVMLLLFASGAAVAVSCYFAYLGWVVLRVRPPPLCLECWLVCVSVRVCECGGRVVRRVGLECWCVWREGAPQDGGLLVHPTAHSVGRFSSCLGRGGPRHSVSSSVCKDLVVVCSHRGAQAPHHSLLSSSCARIPSK